MNTPATNERTNRPAPRRRWPRRLAWTLAALLLILVITTGWLLGTGSGLRFVMAHASAATEGAFSVRQARGRIAGHFELDGVRYHDTGNGLDVRVSRIAATLSPSALLGLQLHVRRLDIGDVDVALLRPSPTAAHDSAWPDLSAPRPIRIDAMRAGAVRVHRGDETLFASDSLGLAASWSDDRLRIERGALRAPDGKVDLDADITLNAPFRGDISGRFDWRNGARQLAGTLHGHGTARQLQATLALTRPAATDLRIQVSQTAPHAWTASLRTPSFDPAPLLGTKRWQRAALRLDAHGDRRQAELQGEVDLNQYAVRIQPMRLHLADGRTRLLLDQLRLNSPQVPGTIDLSGELRLDASPLAGQIQARWAKVTIPADLAGQALASEGRLEAHGNLQGFVADGDFRLGPPDRMARVTLKLAGTPRRLAVNTFEVKEPAGQLALNGTVDLQPVIGWQLAGRARQFDPAVLATGWTGPLDADFSSQGRLPSQGMQASLELKRLAGRLRGKAVDGRGTVALRDKVLSGQLALRSGRSRVNVNAARGDANAIHARIDVATLAEWLPDAAGSLKVDAHVSGRWPALDLRARIDGSGLRASGQDIGTAHAQIHLPDLRRAAGDLDLRADHLKLAGLDFDTLALNAHGADGRQRLQLDASGKPLTLALRIDGTGDTQRWQGRLQQLNLTLADTGDWSLRQAAPLNWDRGQATLQQACLHDGAPELCLGGQRQRDGSVRARYRLQQVPLALFAILAGGDPPVRASGMLDGTGELTRSAGGRLGGQGSLRSAQGELHYEGADRALLSYRNLDARARLDGDRGRITLAAALDHEGSLAGDVQITGPSQALAGHVELHLRSLAFVELLTDQVASIAGRADASLTLAGTLAQPALAGRARLRDFATEIPAAGLKLSDGSLSVDTDDARHFRIDGSVHSGKGTLALAGSVGLGANDPLDLKLRGDAVTVADLPAADVAISPQLRLQRKDDGLHVDGDVTIDRADIDLSKLPGAGAAQPSPDVVVVDAPQAAKTQPPVAIHSDVQVDLGERTHLIGFGLNGNLAGRLHIRETPGKATSAQGQIAVNGTYRAYGQDLKIQQGRLLFASTPIDNPALDIRAVRSLQPTATIDQGQVVGLQVSGTARRPVLTVFSNPVMAQSDALSYLITGKPLSQVKGGEGSMVGAAAQAMGSAAGDLLAKSVGSKLGIDDIGVSNNEALGGTSAFTVGKYLSPRLYLSYGVGLFDPGQVITLRYRLSHRWNIEAQNATGYSRAALNYRYEKKDKSATAPPAASDAPGE